MEKTVTRKRVWRLLAAGHGKAEVFERFRGHANARLANFIVTYPDPGLVDQHAKKIGRIVSLVTLQWFLAGLLIAVMPLPKLVKGGMLAGVTLPFFLLATGFLLNRILAYRIVLVFGVLSVLNFPLTMSENLGTALGGLVVNLVITGYVLFVQTKVFPDLWLFTPRRGKRRRYAFLE